MGQNVSILNKQKIVSVNVTVLEKFVEEVLTEKKSAGKEVSVLIVDNKQIKDTNIEYFGKNRPTDVISFDVSRGIGNNIRREILGDIVVSVEMAVDRSSEFGKTPQDELCLYIVHGVLHLLGYDDMTKSKAVVMHKEEERVLDKINRKLGDKYLSKCMRLRKSG